jgi:LAS superfamily LD-carboxypeptidase LdcB
MNLKTVLPGWLCLCLVSLCGCVHSHINIVKLSNQDEAMVGRILEKLNPLITERRQKEDLPALTFEQLYTPLDEKERTFLRAFQDMDTQSLHITIPYQGIPRHAPQLIAIRGQKICLLPNDCNELPPVFLPKNVYEAYSAMAKNMKKDIGKTLYVESGYRSAAYQLYLFLFYLKNHNYSVRETARFVAWPGYSEHGWPQHQAIDFVNEQGIDGQNRPAEFEALEEYRWLLNNADKYGFEVSYPKGSTMAFEPWHWRYKGK